MNKIELEKLFEEKVTNMRILDEYKNDITDKVKQFIFETIIPEVLKSVMYNNEVNGNEDFEKGQEMLFIAIEQKAEELYNITL